MIQMNRVFLAKPYRACRVVTLFFDLPRQGGEGREGVYPPYIALYNMWTMWTSIGMTGVFVVQDAVSEPGPDPSQPGPDAWAGPRVGDFVGNWDAGRSPGPTRKTRCSRQDAGREPPISTSEGSADRLQAIWIFPVGRGGSGSGLIWTARTANPDIRIPTGRRGYLAVLQVRFRRLAGKCLPSANGLQKWP
jgi:hypothetical protein